MTQLLLFTPSGTLVGCCLGFLLAAYCRRSFPLSLTSHPRLAQALLTASLLLAAYATITGTLLPCYLLMGLPAAVVCGLAIDPQRSTIETSSIMPSWVFVGTASVILLFGLVIRLPGLNDYGLIIDEITHVKEAHRYLLQHEAMGALFDPGFLRYRRSWLYTWQIILAMDLGGVSLRNLRMVSLAWMTAMILPILALARLLRFRRVQTLLWLWWLIVSPFFITLSRWIRMYSMFFTVFLATVVCVYHYLTVKTHRGSWGWGIGALMLALISTHLHALTLTALPGLILYLVWERIRSVSPDALVLKRGRVLGLLAGIGLLLGFVVLFPNGYGVYLSGSGPSLSEVNFSLSFRHLFPVFLVHEPLGWPLGGLLLGAVLLLCRRSPAERFLLCLVVTVTLGLVFFTERYMAFRYIGHVIPLAQALVILGAFRLLDSFHPSIRRAPSLTLLALMVILPAYELPERLPSIWNGSPDMFAHLKILADLTY